MSEEEVETSKEEDKLLLKKIPMDKGALAAAIGLMIISWAALPFVYLLIVKLRRREKKEKKKDEKKVQVQEKEA